MEQSARLTDFLCLLLLILWSFAQCGDSECVVVCVCVFVFYALRNNGLNGQTRQTSLIASVGQTRLII